MNNGICTTERTAIARPTGFLIGLLLGGVVGAAAMFLLAPRSGKATRTRLQHRGVELRDQVAEGVEEAEEQVRATLYRATKGLHEQVEELQEHGQALFDEK
jgi:gas vesicle protein